MQLIASPDLMIVFRKGLREVIPDASGEIPDILNLANTESIELLSNQVEEILGRTSASGLFLRIGSAAFKYIVRYHGEKTGIDSLEFRLQPQKQRMRDCIEKINHLLRNWKAADLRIEEIDDTLNITACAVQGNKSLPGQIVWLHFIAGLYQALLYWAGGGKQYPFHVKPGEVENSLVICFQLQPVD